MKKSKSQVRVGSFILGSSEVEVYSMLDSNEGGAYYFYPDKGRLPRIKVGIKKNDWEHAVSILMHEALELTMNVQGHKYHQAGNFSEDSGACWFFFTHQQFAKIASDVSFFMVKCMPKFAEVFNKHHKIRKK